jgi:DNA-binding NarL/FixJ family response regulator
VRTSFAAGASGYLLKESAFETVVTAIRGVAAGEAYLSSKVASSLIEDYLHVLSIPSSSAHKILTSKEREVLQLLAEGKTNRQVAMQLGVSVKTVETHRRRIMKKLDLRNLAELGKYAIREGVTSLES